jgi:hypothetical protein
MEGRIMRNKNRGIRAHRALRTGQARRQCLYLNPVQARASVRRSRSPDAALRKMLLLIACAVGCATEPTSRGTASVSGQVLRADGGPWSGATVQMTFSAGRDTTEVVANADGGFGVSFVFPGVIRDDQTSSTDCRFAVPSLAAPRAAVTRTITLYPPRLQPEQQVTLREGAT